MRESLFEAMKQEPDLKAVDADFRHLFGSWFNRGFLVLRRIDWTTPANVLEKIIRYAKEQGIGQLSGMTMPSNRGMVNLAKRLGFKIDVQIEEGVVNMELPCNQQAAEG